MSNEDKVKGDYLERTLLEWKETNKNTSREERAEEAKNKKECFLLLQLTFRDPYKGILVFLLSSKIPTFRFDEPNGPCVRFRAHLSIFNI